MTTTTAADLAWAAGFFDGEGGIRISNATRTNLGALFVEVSQVDPVPLEWLAARWGGRVRPAAGARPRRQPAWVWVVSARQALAFLDAIAPYVRIERNRARIALAREFQAGARFGIHGAREDYRGWRFGCFLRMGELNAHGLTPTDRRT